MLRTVRKVPAGKPGTKKLVEQYGDKFLCLRYRVDTETKERIRTVELILDDKKVPNKPEEKPVTDKTLMRLEIGLDEKLLAKRIRAQGGRWDRDGQFWKLSYKKVKDLDLEDRISLKKP